jgi:hypothetical protein
VGTAKQKQRDLSPTVQYTNVTRQHTKIEKTKQLAMITPSYSDKRKCTRSSDTTRVYIINLWQAMREQLKNGWG